MLKLRKSLLACAALLALVVLTAALTPAANQGQGARPATDVNVVNTPTVNVAGPVAVTETRQTALAFRAVDVSFSTLESLGDVDVSQYGQIRVVVRNDSFPFPLVVSIVEGGAVVGTLDVIEVPGCAGGGGCVGSRSISIVYDVPGRAIRFSTLADPRARGDVHVFGR